MKKSLLLIATAVLAMTACTKDVAEMDGGATALGGEINVSAAIDENTRTSMTANGDNLDIAWVKGDGIGMFASDANGAFATNLKYVAESDAANSKLNADGESIQWGTGTHQFYAYYPYTTATDDATAVPISVPAVQEQSEAGNLDHLQPYAFLYAQKSSAQAASVQLSFQNALSVLEVNLCSEVGAINCDAIIFRADDTAEVLSTEGATINLTTGAINTASATNSNEIKVTLGTPVALDATTPQSFYMMVTPGHAGKRFSIYAVVNGEEVLLGNKGIPAAGLPAGVKATLDLNVPAIDLSANGTANSYIVNKAGATYKFKATVKGNGATTTYTWSGGGNDMTRTISEADVTIAPASAKLLWTTNSATNTVVTDVELKEGYIYFKTPASFINGNCVIAAMDASGEIVWSWHIWAVENYNDVAAAKPIKSLSVMLMDRNLGATIGVEQGDPEKQSNVVGLKYQWGRKDPFPAPAGNMTWNDGGNGGKGKEHYSPDGSISYYTYALNDPNVDDESNADDKTLYRYYNSDHGMQQLQASTFDNNFDAAVAQSIKEPWRYHMGYTNAFGGNDNPYIFSYLWGNPTGSAGEGTKSIYDPCPVGWKVASTAVIDAMKGSDLTYLNYGVLCGDHYMPRTGRGNYASTWSWYADCNAYGYLWSDKCYSGYGYGTACVFTMTEDTKNIGYEGKYGTTGFDVRCVSEGTVDLSNLTVDLSATGTANCYIANQSNELYKFKATVKGNGVGALGTEEANITPTKARLLWAQSRPKGTEGGQPSLFGEKNTSDIVIPSSVELKDGYISFATGTFEGNAVIVATDNDDNVLWSWHIWVVKGYNPITSDYYVTTKNINTYMMDRNLGSFHNGNSSNFDDRMGARGLYYQWGRKDPFVGNIQYNGWAAKMTQFNADGTSTSKYASYNNDRIHATINVTDTDINGDAAKLVAWTTSHPINYLSAWGETSYSWMNGVDGTTADWGKLWGNQAGADKGGIKTMYDPCPVGYRVPSTGHFKFITAHGDQASTGYGNNLLNWKFNCVEKIFDESGNVINGDLKAAPYGLNFYIKGAKTASPDAVEGVQDYGVLPADVTTAYFPAQGLMTYSGGGYDGRIYLQTNRPAASNTRWMKAEDGNFYYNATSGSYDQQAKALPVRCIRE